MRVLVVGDPHFKRTNQEETALLEKEVLRLLPQADELVVLGDVLDRFSLRALCRANKWLVSLSKLIPTTVLIGNHEREDNTDYLSDIHPFIGMERDNLTFVAQPLKKDGILYVPYVPPGRFKEAIEGKMGGVSLVFAHQSFVGCCDPKALDAWDSEVKVISGHIHNRGVLYRGMVASLESQWNVYYPGASLCNNFGDELTRYVCIVDTESLSVEEVVIKSIPRLTRTLTKDYTEEDLDFIEAANGYSRIEIIGTHTECNVLRMSPQVVEARKRGADVKSLPFLETVPSREETGHIDFHTRWMKRLENVMDEEGVTYIKQVLN